MKNKLMQTAAGTILGLMLLIGGTYVAASGQQIENSSTVENPRSIEGVWRNRVTVKDCQSGTVLATFPGLLNYHQGGTMSETGATNPALRSSGYGIWEFRGRRTYTGKFTFYTFNPDGSLAGSQEINQNIVIARDGTRLTDNAHVNIFDANGNFVFNVCATAEGTRFR